MEKSSLVTVNNSSSSKTGISKSTEGHFHIVLHQSRKCKRSLLESRFCFPTSLIAVLLLLLLTYNGASIFCISIPFPAKTSPAPATFLPGNVHGEQPGKLASSSSKHSSSVMYAVKEENPTPLLKTRLPLFRKSEFLVPHVNSSPSKENIHMPILQNSSYSVNQVKNSSIPTKKKPGKKKSVSKLRRSEAQPKPFAVRVKEFFNGGSSTNTVCKLRFFMTWISSLESFNQRELFTIESLFKSHPNGCLLIVSKSMDSSGGVQLLKPFSDKGFQIMAVSPDFNYLFEDTLAAAWFDQLQKGNIRPGRVTLGQNLSNLLRLALLYKFGGIYIDTDIIILKNFSKLRNSIGAQTIDLETGSWSRLNNAVMIFDKNHPLLLKFIEEFALTFDGNKWGHNGPYLVSRVVSRVSASADYNFTVLPPPVFYPVGWGRIDGLFYGPRDEAHSKWLRSQLRHIRKESFCVHLWNRHSRNLEVEEGSIIDQIMSDSCLFCNSSISPW